MSLLDRIFGRKNTTAQIARDRLQIIIAQERRQSQIPDYLPTLRRELMEVLSKYVNISPDDIRISQEKNNDVEVLELNITLSDLKDDKKSDLKKEVSDTIDKAKSEAGVKEVEASDSGDSEAQKKTELKTEPVEDGGKDEKPAANVHGEAGDKAEDGHKPEGAKDGSKAGTGNNGHSKGENHPRGEGQPRRQRRFKKPGGQGGNGNGNGNGNNNQAGQGHEAKSGRQGNSRKPGSARNTRRDTDSGKRRDIKEMLKNEDKGQDDQ